MTVQEALKIRVGGDAGVTALIGNRLFPITAPQDVVSPYVTYQQVTSVPIASTTGTNALENGLWQFDCWAKDPTTADTVAKAVRATLNDFKGVVGDQELTARFSGKRQDYEQDTRLYRESYDFRIWNCQL